MSTLKRSLKSSVFVTNILMALPALAQEPETGQPALAPDDAAEARAEPRADKPAAQPPAAKPQINVGAQPATTAAPRPAAAATQSEGPSTQLGNSTAVTHGGADVGTGGWTMSYHGYFFAPMRFGIGKREDFQRLPPKIPPQSITTAGTTDPAAFGARAYEQATLHAPLIPDDQYNSWQHTNHNRTDWAEMYFTVGNQVAEGTLDIEGYNFTTGSYAEPYANFGIAQGFVTIRPEMPWENVRVMAKVGTNWGRYGTAGRWDMGEYTTYLFGRTKTMGGTVREEFDLGPITLAFEQGYGVKRPDPSIFNTAKFTNLAHFHGYVLYEGLMVGAHFLSAWSQDEDHDGQGCSAANENSTTMCQYWWGVTGSSGGTPQTTVGNVNIPTGTRAFGTTYLPAGGEANVWLPDGRLNISGIEVKYDAHPFGLVYLGWSNISAKNALTVGPAPDPPVADPPALAPPADSAAWAATKAAIIRGFCSDGFSVARAAHSCIFVQYPAWQPASVVWIWTPSSFPSNGCSIPRSKANR